MDLHVPTLLLALLLGFLVLTAELAVCFRLLQVRRELLAWTAGCWLLLGGLTLVVAPTGLPVGASATIGHGLVAGGIVLFAVALHRLLGKSPAPRWLYAALAGVIVGTVLMLDWPAHLRSAALSCAFASMLAPGIDVIARRGWHAERSLRTVALTMGLAVLALVGHAAHLLVQGEQGAGRPDAYFDPSTWVLLAFTGLLGAGFGFALAVFERVNRLLEELATHDGMTGCYNRSTTDAMLAHELTRGRRLHSPVAFVMFDLDRFKRINDRHGHGVGDTVLKKFAQTVRERLRSSDLLGRTGGEEFALILPATDLAGARSLVEDIRLAVQGLRVPGADGRSVRVTVSSGIAVATPDAEVTAEALFCQADTALFAAKRAGRNRVVHYSHEQAPELEGLTVPLTVQ